MAKKIKKIFIMFLIVACAYSFTAPLPVEATSGRLKANTICKCNGKKYGRHGKGKGHWHRAVKKGKYYYASGKVLKKCPCGKKCK